MNAARAAIGLVAAAAAASAMAGDYEVSGTFGQVTWGAVTIGGYWFNAGSREQVFVGMIGATF
jgi:hypothetical protein